MSYQLDDLLYLMQRLRDPQHGCPWDLQQDYASIVPHTLEEAYEVADAIEQGQTLTWLLNRAESRVKIATTE